MIARCIFNEDWGEENGFEQYEDWFKERYYRCTDNILSKLQHYIDKLITEKLNEQGQGWAEDFLAYTKAMEELKDKEIKQAKKEEREPYNNLIQEILELIDNAADFRNGNTWSGIDEGEVVAGKIFAAIKKRWQALKDGT
jgi:uncharacterized protein YaaW (UPF0174 family)